MERRRSKGGGGGRFLGAPAWAVPAGAVALVLFFVAVNRQSAALDVAGSASAAKGGPRAALAKGASPLAAARQVDALAERQATLAAQTAKLAAELEATVSALEVRGGAAVAEARPAQQPSAGGGAAGSDKLGDALERLRASRKDLRPEGKATLGAAAKAAQARAAERLAQRASPRAAAAAPSSREWPVASADGGEVPAQYRAVGQGKRSGLWKEVSADETRRDAVKAAMKHAWDSYAKYAFGMDELQPLSRRGKNMFGGLGATVIDSLDTLYIMGLMDEYQRARDWVETDMNVDRAFEASVFETTIRCVGGLLTAHDLSGDEMFVRRAREIADRLLPAYNTQTGIPLNIVNLRTGVAKNPAWTSGASTLAEFGTQQLEWVALALKTGDPRYAEKVEHALKVAVEATSRPGNIPQALFPLFLNPNTLQWTQAKVSFGAMGDSFYEYLLKMWVWGGKTKSQQRYRDLFDETMRAMIDNLIEHSDPGRLTYIAELDRGSKVHKMDHLVCFASGMLVLGAEGPHAEEYLNLGKELGRTCYEMYHSQPSGVAPELVNFRSGQGMMAGAPHNLLRPETVESLFLLYRKTGDEMYREWGWEIFQAFERNCRVPDGYAGLRDVRVAKPAKDDTMQSFFLAETLKYLYLLFADSDTINLDEWVFNTEAHPLKIVHRNSTFFAYENNSQSPPVRESRERGGRRRWGGRL